MFQDEFLATLCEQQTIISVFLLSGIQLVGTLKDFDHYTLVLNGNNGELQMIYKRHVATLQPHDVNRTKNTRRNRLFR